MKIKNSLNYNLYFRLFLSLLLKIIYKWKPLFCNSSKNWYMLVAFSSTSWKNLHANKDKRTFIKVKWSLKRWSVFNVLARTMHHWCFQSPAWQIWRGHAYYLFLETTASLVVTFSLTNELSNSHFAKILNLSVTTQSHLSQISVTS